MKAHTAVLLSCICLAGCVAGPDYSPPEIASPTSFDAPAPSTPADEESLASWWLRFDDPVLNALVDHALAQNIDLKIAASRVREARLQQVAAGAAGMPQVGLSAGANNTQFSKNAGLSSLASLLGGSGQGSGSGSGVAAPGSGISTFSAGFDAGWEIDLFGGAKRGREAAAATAEAAEWTARDARVSFIAEVADDYLKLRAIQQQGALLDEQLNSASGLLDIAKTAADTGLQPGSAAFQQRSLIDTVNAEIVANRAQQQALRRQIAVLLAVPVDQLPAALQFPGTSAQIAIPTIAPGLPSELLRRRPDIRAAERQLAASTARIGVATADLYPKFSLTGVVELLSTSLASLVSANSIETIASGNASFPLFDFGRNRALVGVAREQADQSYLAYRKTVVTALSEVGGALDQFQAEQERADALRSALANAQRAEASATASYRAGLTNFAPVYQAQIARQDAASAVLASEAAQREDLIMLYKALGGGWLDLASPISTGAE